MAMAIGCSINSRGDAHGKGTHGNRHLRVCREREAVDICRGCGVALCRKCRRVELGRTRGEEEVEVLVFCSECSERLKEQHGEGEEAIFDLERIADMVNQEARRWRDSR
jgi:hypothetical protein